MELSDLLKAVELDLESARAGCGGDGLGCEAFRPYYDSPERRYQKCGRCPMDALFHVRQLLSGDTK